MSQYKSNKNNENLFNRKLKGSSINDSAIQLEDIVNSGKISNQRKEDSLLKDTGKDMQRKIDNHNVISRVINLNIHERYELNGVMYDTKEEALQALKKLEGQFDNRLFKVEYYNKIGISKEKIERYYHIDVSRDDFSILVDELSAGITHRDLLKVYLEYHIGKQIIKDNVTNKLFTNYTITKGNLKEAQTRKLIIITKNMLRDAIKYTN